MENHQKSKKHKEKYGFLTGVVPPWIISGAMDGATLAFNLKYTPLPESRSTRTALETIKGGLAKGGQAY